MQALSNRMIYLNHKLNWCKIIWCNLSRWSHFIEITKVVTGNWFKPDHRKLKLDIVDFEALLAFLVYWSIIPGQTCSPFNFGVLRLLSSLVSHPNNTNWYWKENVSPGQILAPSFLTLNVAPPCNLFPVFFVRPRFDVTPCTKYFLKEKSVGNFTYLLIKSMRIKGGYR